MEGHSIVKKEEVLATADLFRQESTSEPVERSADAVTWPDVPGPHAVMQPGNDISDPDGMMALIGTGCCRPCVPEAADGTVNRRYC